MHFHRHRREELDKAEEIADLAMLKMPVDEFGYYTLLEPYINAYFEVGNKDKARDLFNKALELNESFNSDYVSNNYSH